MEENKSRGNFDEEIYSLDNLPLLEKGELSRVEYKTPSSLRPYFESHPAYSSDFVAFQHIELWLPRLTLKDQTFSLNGSKTPLVLTCRVASNRQKMGPLKFNLGNIKYGIFDFQTGERISSSETLINNKQKLPHLFESEKRANWGYKNGLFISMQDNFLGKNLLEVKIEDEDKKLFGRLLFQTRLPNFENGYARILNSGEARPLREFTTKRLIELIKEESFLQFDKEPISFRGIEPSGYVDESMGFSLAKKNWDWMIFKSDSDYFPNDVKLIIGKKCKRAGYDYPSEEIATLFLNGRIYRLKGKTLFDYDLEDLTKPWKIYFSDFKENGCGIEVATNQVAPFVEESFMNERKGSVKVTLDLQRIIADTSVNIHFNGEEIESRGIGSFESNKGMERGTKYFKD
ncbi:Uncharacterised protein [uncultured archaeon]|nr:Uncharacterised protein [uncultured archaeon]